MKTELTQELKERFLMQYCSQNIMWFSGDEEEMGVFVVSKNAVGEVIQNAYLTLRPLSDLTDEEAIEVTKIMWPLVETSQTVQEGRHFLVYIANGGRMYAELSDYLRSIGVALPFMGHSIEELVAAGWVKLIEP